MTDMVPLILLVVATLTGSAKAGIFDATSQVTVSTITNNFQTQQQTTNGVSTSPGVANFTVEGINGLNDTLMEINPKGIVATYKPKIVAWAPNASRLKVITVELSANPRNQNVSLTELPRSVGGYRPIKIVNTNQTDVVVGQYGDIADFFTAAACYSGFTPISVPLALSGVCTGGQGISADQFAKYAQAQSNLWLLQQYFNGNTSEWIMDADLQFKFIQQSLEAARAYFAANNDAVENLVDLNVNLQVQMNNYITENTANLQALAAQSAANAVETAQVATDLALVANAGADAINKTISLVMNLTAQLAQTQNATNIRQYNDEQDNLQKFQTAGVSVSQLANGLQRLATNQDYVFPLTQLAWQQINLIKTMNDINNEWNLYTEFIGLPPAPDPFNLPQNLFQLNIEVPLLKYIYNKPTGTSPPIEPRATITTLTLTCGSYWLTLNQIPVSGWYQFLQTLGPIGCNSDIKNQNNSFCNCFIVVSEISCAMDSDSNGNPFSINVENFVSDPNPTINQALVCSASSPVNRIDNPYNNLPTVPSAFPTINNNIIRSETDYNTWQYQFCTDRPINSMATTIYMFSSFFGQSLSVPAPTPGSCTNQLYSLFNLNVNQQFGVAFGVAMFAVDAFTFTATGMSSVASQIVGQLPDNLTYVASPFVRNGNTTTGVSETAYMAFFNTKNWLAVYRYDFVSLTQDVDVFMNGVKVDQPVTSSVEIATGDIPFPDGTHLIGDPNTIFRNFIWDVPFSQTVPSPNAPARCGGPLYTMCTNLANPQNAPNYPVDCNITSWVQANAVPYDHSCGGSNLAGYQCALTTVDGSTICDIDSCQPSASGDICEILDVWQVVAEPTVVQFIAKPDQYVQTITGIVTPQGPLVASQGSACPNVVPSISDNDEILLSLTNTLAINNAVRVVQNGLCPKVTDITLNPREVRAFSVRECPGSSMETVTFFFNPGLGYYVSCNQTFPVNINGSNPTLYPASGTLGYTESRTTQAQSTTLLTTQNVQTMMNQLIHETILAQTQVFVAAGIPVADTSSPLGPYNAVYAKMQNLTTTAQNNAVAAQSDYLNFTNPNIALQEQAAQLEANTQADIVVMQQALVNFTNSTNASGAGLVVLNNIATVIGQNPNATAAGIALMAGVAQEIQDEQPDNPFALSGLGSFFTTVGKGILGIPGDLVSVAKAAGQFIVDTAKGVLGPIASMFSSMGGMVVMIIIIIVVVAVLGGGGYLIYYFVSKRKKDKIDNDVTAAVLKVLQEAHPELFKQYILKAKAGKGDEDTEMGATKAVGGPTIDDEEATAAAATTKSHKYQRVNNNYD